MAASALRRCARPGLNSAICLHRSNFPATPGAVSAGPVALQSSRGIADIIFRHKRVGKFEVPVEDADGRPIPRAPNGHVTPFELYTQGALTDETSDAYRWGAASNQTWMVRFALNFCLGIWVAYYLIQNGVHILTLDRLERRRIVDDLIEKEKAAEAAAAGGDGAGLATSSQ
eukprot:scpid85065/ scgid26241/ 